MSSFETTGNQGNSGPESFAVPDYVPDIFTEEASKEEYAKLRRRFDQLGINDNLPHIFSTYYDEDDIRICVLPTSLTRVKDSQPTKEQASRIIINRIHRDILTDTRMANIEEYTICFELQSVVRHTSVLYATQEEDNSTWNFNTFTAPFITNKDGRLTVHYGKAYDKEQFSTPLKRFNFDALTKLYNQLNLINPASQDTFSSFNFNVCDEG